MLVVHHRKESHSRSLTCAPRPTTSSTMARPMPRVPPVTRHFLAPSNSLDECVAVVLAAMLLVLLLWLLLLLTEPPLCVHS